DAKALALAGIIGGNDTAVGDDTQHIFLECAFFTPENIAGKARQYGLHTDSSHRFERGVDFTLQHRAIERATQLIVEIAGGEVGSITEATDENNLPKREAVNLRKQRLEKILGTAVADDTVTDIFKRLDMEVLTTGEGWQVVPAGFRFDIAIEADLIEEVARIYGYNNLPNNSLLMRSSLGNATESILPLDRVKDVLVDRGYQEAITYSFVDEGLQNIIAPNDELVRLQNPISADMAVMRTTLWCGLINAALHNTKRQQTRLRLFETGLRFVQQNGETIQEKMLAGLALGSANPEQWGETSRKVDFYDVKADVESLFALTGCKVTFIPVEQTALHPYQTAAIQNEAGETIGYIGMLHPNLEKQLGFDNQVFLFELKQDLLLNKQQAKFKPLSKYPSVRRDLALIVKDDINANDIINSIKSCKQTNLQDVLIFEIYRGKGVAEGYKSVALGITLQNDQQTLTDSEIDAIVSTLLNTLTQDLGAKLRD
ncbi:partial phenylalanyl-tRNA synthetase beta chain, partial [uncultured bacterium]